MTTTELCADACESLRAAYAEARRLGPTRHRDIAERLGVSEGELIAAHAGSADPGQPLHAQRLRGPWPALVTGLEPVGPVMALTRNRSCVHEKVGTYRDISAQGPAGREMGLVLGEDIDLRVFYSRWAHGFAVNEHTDRGLQRSLQFFDASGTAVHKVFARAPTDLEAWQALVQRHRSDDASPGLAPAATPALPAERLDTEVEVEAFRADWAALRDTHEFLGLLRRHGVSRTQALRLADPGFAQRVDDAAARELLLGAAEQALPIMVFVGNPGMIQIHTGPVGRVEVLGPWLNVLDPAFNLHLREDHIAAAWAVRKPTTDGLVTSLELFDAHGETIAMLFGARKPGKPELCAWRRLVDTLVSAPAWVPETKACSAC